MCYDLESTRGHKHFSQSFLECLLSLCQCELDVFFSHSVPPLAHLCKTGIKTGMIISSPVKTWDPHKGWNKLMHTGNFSRAWHVVSIRHVLAIPAAKGFTVLFSMMLEWWWTQRGPEKWFPVWIPKAELRDSIPLPVFILCRHTPLTFPEYLLLCTGDALFPRMFFKLSWFPHIL